MSRWIKCKRTSILASALADSHRFTSKFETMPAQQQAHMLVSTHEALSNFFKSRDRRLDLCGKDTNRHVLFFHMSYQMALLITLPPFLRCFAISKGYSTGNPNYIILILRSLTSAASMMIRLVRMYRDAHPEQWKTANPVVIHHLLSAAIVLLMNATSQTTSLRTQSTRWLKVCVELLVQLSGPWPDRANKTIKVIRVLAGRWGVLGTLPLQFSYPVEPASSQDLKNDSQDYLSTKTMPPIPVPTADSFHGDPFVVPGFNSADMSSLSSLSSYSNFDFTIPTNLNFGVDAQHQFDDLLPDGTENWLFDGEQDVRHTYWGN